MSETTNGAEPLTLEGLLTYAANQALLGEDEGHEDPQGNAVAVALDLLTPAARLALAAELLAGGLPYQKHGLAADGRTPIPSVYPILTLGEDEQAFALLSAAPECVRVVRQTDEQAAMAWAQFGVLSVEASAPRKEVL